MRLKVDGVERVFTPEALVVVGYAGRDSTAVQAHVDELAELGVPRPSSVPLFMVFPPRLIHQSRSIAVAGAMSSGEAELVVVVDGAETFVTVGSDHTDRALETVDIAASKGVCPKPVAAEGWAARATQDRWDDLGLRSRIGGGALYQDGSVAVNRPPLELVSSIPWAGARPRCFVAFTGTVPVIGEIRPSGSFHAELTGPGLDTIELHYRVEPIPSLL